MIAISLDMLQRQRFVEEWCSRRNMQSLHQRAEGRGEKEREERSGDGKRERERERFISLSPLAWRSFKLDIRYYPLNSGKSADTVYKPFHRQQTSLNGTNTEDSEFKRLRRWRREWVKTRHTTIRCQRPNLFGQDAHLPGDLPKFIDREPLPQTCVTVPPVVYTP